MKKVFTIKNIVFNDLAGKVKIYFRLAENGIQEKTPENDLQLACTLKGTMKAPQSSVIRIEKQNV